MDLKNILHQEEHWGGEGGRSSEMDLDAVAQVHWGRAEAHSGCRHLPPTDGDRRGRGASPKAAGSAYSWPQPLISLRLLNEETGPQRSSAWAEAFIETLLCAKYRPTYRRSSGNQGKVLHMWSLEHGDEGTEKISTSMKACDRDHAMKKIMSDVTSMAVPAPLVRNGFSEKVALIWD